MFPDIEQRVNDLPQSIGLNNELLLTFGSWMVNSGGTLAQAGAATTGIGFSFDNGAVECHRFGAAVSQTSFLWTTFAWPGWMRVYRGDRLPVVDIAVRARKAIVTGTPTDNTDLALTARLSILPAGTAAWVNGTAASWTLPAMTAADAPDTAKDYTAALVAGFTDAQLAQFQPGTLCKVALSVNEAVGTDLAVLIQSIRIGTSIHLRGQDRLIH